MSVGLRKLGHVTVLAHETDDEFLLKAEPHRRELLAHCYRMTGSLHDAEDLVQETYIRAWKAYSGFKGQSSLRTWLYRIATDRPWGSEFRSRRRHRVARRGAMAGAHAGPDRRPGRSVHDRR
jgi:DNA-directed RNA polymerase specialized sigma24 family protein